MGLLTITHSHTVHSVAIYPMRHFRFGPKFKVIYWLWNLRQFINIFRISFLIYKMGMMAFISVLK